MRFRTIATILAVVLLSAAAYGDEADNEKKRAGIQQDRSSNSSGFVQARTHSSGRHL